MMLEKRVPHTLAGQARSSCVHRQATGRDYAAPLQLKWKRLSLTSERLGCSKVE
jgi:hypothetical protein